MNALTRGTALVTCIALGLFAHAQITSAAVEHALTETLRVMNVPAVLTPGSVRFAQGSIRRGAGSAGVVVERASVSGSRLEARVRCTPVVACLPFYATAYLQFESRANVERPWSVLSRRESHDCEAIRPGERVTFLREANGVRILQRAVALQRGCIGEMMRVRAAEGHHEVMRGRVFEKHVVRSES